MAERKKRNLLNLLDSAVKRRGRIEISIGLFWFALSSVILVWMQDTPLEIYTIAALVGFNGALLTMLINYLSNSERSIPLTKRVFLLLALISCLVLLISGYASKFHPLYAPITAAALVFSIIYNKHISYAIYLSLYLSFVLALKLSNPFFYFTIFAANSLLTVQMSSRLVERNSLAASSIRSALGSIGTMCLLYLFFGWFDISKIASDATVILVTSICSVVAVLGLLPYLEDIFFIVTPTKLLELANPNNPLLKRLSIEAPGTYHHSLLTANLAESATEAIGGNALLARVGAYYHDIGKIKRPFFFIENQSAFDNPHHKINPRMSSMIITSHTKEGAELAKEYKLPRVITNIIEQHHGTSVMSFFYKNFQDLKTAETDKHTISEDDFRYGGPKPQTREAAIIMLADSCEAAVRALEKPTPSRINNLIGRIIKEKMDNGQLDESNLTFQEITKIKISFQATIANMFHNRIKYNDTSKD